MSHGGERERASLPGVSIAILAFAARNGRGQLRSVHDVGRVDADAREPSRNDFHLLVALPLLRRRGERLGAFRVHARGATVVEDEADDQTAHQDAGQHGENDNDGQIRCLDIESLRQDLFRLQDAIGERRFVLGRFRHHIELVLELGSVRVGRHAVTVHLQRQMARSHLKGTHL